MPPINVRQRGARKERDVAKYLSEKLEREIVRAASVSGGLQRGVDLLEKIPDSSEYSSLIADKWAIEVKGSSEGNTRIKDWARQAKQQARDIGAPKWALIVTLKNVSIHDSYVYIQVPKAYGSPLGWMSLATWTHLARAASSSR